MKLFKRKPEPVAAPVNPYDVTVTARRPDDELLLAPGGGFMFRSEIEGEALRVRNLEEKARLEEETRQAGATDDFKPGPHRVDAANLI